MKRVLVLNVAADYGGSETVLRNFFQELEESDVEYVFLLSRDFGELPYKVMIYPWIKKSWFHRLYFDYFVLPRIIRNNKYDSIYSMQNTFPFWLRRANLKKFLLVHQSLQYYEGFINIFTLEGIKLNLRKWLIGPMIKRSIRTSDHIFVQSEWMKQKIIEDSTYSIPPVTIVSTFTISSVTSVYNDNKSGYFYPAGSSLLKNHLFLIGAWIRLQKEYNLNPRLYFTINENDNNFTLRLAKLIKKYDLNIELIGYLSTSEMDRMYTQSILVYPSLIETYAIPLYEGMNYNLIILAIDKDYSSEALMEYPNGFLFSSEKDFIDLVRLLENNQIEYVNKPLNKEKKYPKVSEFISTLIN